MTNSQTSLDQDLRTALDELSKRATPGPWAAESEKSEGSYGSGEDTREGYETATIVTEAEIRHGAAGVLFESHNSTVGSIAEESDDEWFRAWDEVSEANAKFIVALVNAYRSGALTAPPRPDHAGGVEEARAAFDRWFATTGLESQHKGLTAYAWHEAWTASYTIPAQAPDKVAEREGVAQRAYEAFYAGTGPRAWTEIGEDYRQSWRAVADALAPKTTGTEPDRGVGAEEIGDAPWLAYRRWQEETKPGYWCESGFRAGYAAGLAATPTPPTAQGDGTSQDGIQRTLCGYCDPGHIVSYPAPPVPADREGGR